MRIELDTPFFEDGIRSTNFFNGRLLSAEDLSQEQQARHAEQQRLGRALGEGIAYGLEVRADIGGGTAQQPVVMVSPGLALNRHGEALELSREVEVSLLRGADNAPPTATGRGDFQTCSVPASVYVSGTGVYLLVLSPASGREGRASASGLGGYQTGCDARRLVDGVQFRLIDLRLSQSDLADTQRLRNRVAHQCFGTTDASLAGFVANPFGAVVKSYGLLDQLRPGFLTDCDVPLALVHWSDSGGIRFVDRWSVRRRPARVTEAGRWSPAVGDRRASEGEATLLQFQEQIEELARTRPGPVRAQDNFQYLPPAGVLPLSGLPGSVGFDYLRFFDGLAYRTELIEGARLEPLLRQSIAYPPIALAQQELIWLYLVRENQQAPASGLRPQPYLVFASSQLPDQGEARFNVSKWTYASYSIRRTPPPGG